MAKSSVGRLQNLSVSVQRRWNNVLSDATRQVPSLLMHWQACCYVLSLLPNFGPCLL